MLSAALRSSGAAFPRGARLTRAREFRRVFASAQRFGDRFFTVLVALNDYRHGRLGLAVSKKAAKTAVARNRIKRAVRETFRHWQDEIGPVDAVVIAKSPACPLASRALQNSMVRLWRRVAQRYNDS